ncbi:MAG: hypothetical protein CMA42_01380 [Euryarchaeota archaeon]|nr:hypothetical protein [Euryarchaeota archaeon]
MSDDALEWKASLIRPSMTLSRILLILGAWGLILNVVNLTIGAYSGKKALWSGFFFSGASNTNSSDLVLGDLVFLLVSLSFCFLGLMGMRNALGGDNGLLAALSSDFSSFGNKLFSSEQGYMPTLGSWLIVFGVIFYLSWSIFNETWLDPGVYSVMITLISFGYGILIFADSER